MEQNKNKALVENNPELLSEMESLLILGGLSGKDDDRESNFILSNCDTDNSSNTYCGDANRGNCITQCGCLIPGENGGVSHGGKLP